jgi:hypothetical protein
MGVAAMAWNFGRPYEAHRQKRDGFNHRVTSRHQPRRHRSAPAAVGCKPTLDGTIRWVGVCGSASSDWRAPFPSRFVRISVIAKAWPHEALNPIEHWSDSDDHVPRNNIGHPNSVKHWYAFVCSHLARAAKTIECRPQRRVLPKRSACELLRDAVEPLAESIASNQLLRFRRMTAQTFLDQLIGRCFHRRKRECQCRAHFRQKEQRIEVKALPNVWVKLECETLYTCPGRLVEG